MFVKNQRQRMTGETHLASVLITNGWYWASFDSASSDRSLLSATFSNKSIGTRSLFTSLATRSIHAKIRNTASFVVSLSCSPCLRTCIACAFRPLSILHGQLYKVDVRCTRWVKRVDGASKQLCLGSSTSSVCGTRYLCGGDNENSTQSNVNRRGLLLEYLPSEY